MVISLCVHVAGCVQQADSRVPVPQEIFSPTKNGEFLLSELIVVFILH